MENCRTEFVTSFDFPDLRCAPAAAGAHRDQGFLVIEKFVSDGRAPAAAWSWCTRQTKAVMIDEGRLNQLIGQMVSDLGGASSVAMVRIATMICVPTSLSQEVGSALGAQAGEARLREVITAGGFTKMRRATETPFNMILEARL